MSNNGTTTFQLAFGTKTVNFTFEGVTRFSKHKTGDNSNSGRTQYISEPNLSRSGREEVVKYNASGILSYKFFYFFDSALIAV